MKGETSHPSFFTYIALIHVRSKARTNSLPRGWVSNLAECNLSDLAESECNTLTTSPRYLILSAAQISTRRKLTKIEKKENIKRFSQDNITANADIFQQTNFTRKMFGDSQTTDVIYSPTRLFFHSFYKLIPYKRLAKTVNYVFI